MSSVQGAPRPHGIAEASRHGVARGALTPAFSKHGTAAGSTSIHHVRAAGADLTCKVQGEGAPVACIAGFGCDFTIWDGMASLLASQFRVIRFDNRGVRPRPGQRVDVSELSIRSMARDAVAVLDALGIPRAHIVGHSMGGQIALELALSFPERVASLALLSSYGRADGRLAAWLAHFGELAAKVDAKDYVRLLLPWIFSDDFYTSPENVEGAVEFYAENPGRPSAEVLLAQSRAAIAADMTGRLGTLQVPALVAVAMNDILTPPRLSRELAAQLRGAEFDEIQSGAHAFIVERSASVARRLSTFLAVHPLAARDHRAEFR